jgi:NAD(P)-dependent dehydrogenase (short-subunit alcohol dehydrogenase family)
MCETAMTAGYPVAVITGACGGMGAACARVFARSRRLILTDVHPERLASLADEIERDGGSVLAKVAGDISKPATIRGVVAAVAEAGELTTLVHTAGVSPTLADWRTIVEVNLGGTVRLLDAVEPLLAPRAAAVLIASIAGHMFPPTPDVAAVLDTAAEPGLADRLEPHLPNGPRGLSGPAYGASKAGVMRVVEQRARAWSERGARIVSISPGLIATPMGLKEAREDEAVSSLLVKTPAGRWGTALDIASVAEFLASDRAAFVTGCDLRVDGGLIAALHHGANA